MTKVLLIVPPLSQYQVLEAFTEGLRKAFMRLGVECTQELFDENIISRLMYVVRTNPPDFTVGFNVWLDRDVTGLPHVTYTVDAPHKYLSNKNPNLIVACVDESHVPLMRKWSPGTALFLPHAVDRDFASGLDSKRCYDVIMIGSHCDPESLRREWKAQFSKEERVILERAVESPPVLAALPADLPGKELGILWEAADFYLRAKDRLTLLQSIDTPVHVFGEGFKGAKNIILHDPVSFPEALKLMQQSKIVLNSSPTFPSGSHERVFNGLAAGACVISSGSSYLEGQFPKGSGVRFYPPMEAVNEAIDDWLSDEKLRHDEAEKGRAIVMKHHTWDNRAETLLREVAAFVG